MSASDFAGKALALSKQYPADLNGHDFITEMQHLLSVHKAKFEYAQLTSLDLLNLFNTLQSFRSISKCLC